MDPPTDNHDVSVQHWMKSTDDDGKSLKSDNRSMENKMETLLSNSERVVELLKEYLSTSGHRASQTFSSSESSGAGPADVAANTGEEGVAIKKKRKKKKKKKAKGGKEGAATNWVPGNLIKASMAVGMLSIVFLMSVTLGLGQGRVGMPSPSILRKRSGQTTSAKVVSAINSPTPGMPDEEQSAVAKQEKFSKQHIIQESYPPHTSTDRVWYYAVLENGGYCDDDPAHRPRHYHNQEFKLFGTEKECCNHWFPHLEDDECMANSPSSSSRTHKDHITRHVQAVVSASPPMDSDSTASPLPDSVAGSSPQEPSISTEGADQASSGPVTGNSPEAPDSRVEHREELLRPTFLPGEGSAPCPDLLNIFNNYNVGEKVTYDGQVIESKEGGWVVVGSCNDGAYIASPSQGASESLSRLPAGPSKTFPPTPSDESPSPFLPSDALSDLPPLNSPQESTTSPSGVPPDASSTPEPETSVPSGATTVSNSPTAAVLAKISDHPAAAHHQGDHPQGVDHSNQHQGGGAGADSGPAYNLTTDLQNGIECDANPENCGCDKVAQADYRGLINTTADGSQCERWDADWIQKQFLDYPAAYPDAGLDENYCRNPHEDDRAWCFVADGSGGGGGFYCSVPSCRPLNFCPLADNRECGCDIVRQSDYRGTINTNENGLLCEPWGAEASEEFPNAGLDENHCRNVAPGVFTQPVCLIVNDEGGGELELESCHVPHCDRCSCMPPCGSPNREKCACPSFFQAENCCEGENEASCKCDYLKDACRKSLESNITDLIFFCEDAEAACCKNSNDPYCKCGMYEQMCSDRVSQTSCELAAESCCESAAEFANSPCLCDFYSYAANDLGYESESKAEHCEGEPTAADTFLERLNLDNFFIETGGEHWFDKTGWQDDSYTSYSHCQWFGLKCDENGFVTEIRMRKNNLTGVTESHLFLPHLKTLDLAENTLSGEIYKIGVGFYLRQMVHIDISNNDFSGHAEMTFSPTTLYANYSHNKFTSVSFRGFNPAHESLQVVDLSYNLIDQDVSEVFLNVPPNLKDLILSDNAMRGTLPDPLPNLENIRRLSIANNNIHGPLPDFSRATPRVKELDLSNQGRIEIGGLTGGVSADFSRLGDLLVLNLALNNLTSIPSELGNLQQLKVLNVSSNLLNQPIPRELGKLADILAVLDISDNELNGSIPSTFANFEDTSVHLSGNADLLLHRAPLMLCFRPKFDLVNNAGVCPLERNALKEFYESAKGQEWTDNYLWIDDYASHCSWHGIKCDEMNNTIELNLTSNSLSGKLSEMIGNLTFMTVMDLTDNDIQGPIPSEIGLLSKLTHFRIPYNEFIDSMPAQLGNLPDLELIQVHGNRISGTMPILNWAIKDPSSFVSDCGNPTDFDSSLHCTECTMCCNNEGGCYPQGKTWVQNFGAEDLSHVILRATAFFIGACGVMALAVYAHDKHRNRNLPSHSTRSSPLTIDRDNKYALETIGDDSVYQFFLGNSWSGWVIALATIALQMTMLSIFVGAAEINLSDETTDLVYTWKCARDHLVCENTSDLDRYGWLAFAILMAANQGKDLVNGSKMIVLSAKQRHDPLPRFRYFVGGTLLSSVTVFTLLVSIAYNHVIATSNTDVIVNSVVILFITDMDELFYGILEAANSRWVEGMSFEAEGSEEGDVSVQDLKSEVQELRKSLRLLKQQLERKGIIAQPQDATAWDERSRGSRKSRSPSGERSDRSRSPPRFGKKRGQQRRG